MDGLSFAEARHLAVRTGFSADWSIVNHYRGKSKGSVIESLLHSSVQKTPVPSPMTPWKTLDQLNESSYQGQKKARAIARKEGISLKLWWIKHMLSTTTPLTERMTLFWHNHFTSSVNKVLQPQLLYLQNKTLRQHALGNFGDLLHAILRDPAMLIYLDGMMNQKGKINENFAREFLELFTLGQGHFSEQDIAAVAHGLTGWQVDRFSATSSYNPEFHSQERLPFLNKTSVYSVDDIVSHLLEQPRTAEFIAEKFWKEFVSLTVPEPAVIRQWASVFRRANYDVRVLLQTVLSSEVFWATSNRGQRIKSPVELIVGTSRMLAYNPLSDREMVNTFRSLGQSLFDPPDVAGWRGGESWINTETLLVRNSFLQRVQHGTNASVVSQVIPDVSQTILLQWILAIEPVLSPNKTADKTQFVQALLLDPSYQLT